MQRRRSFWIVQAREARVHAAIVAVVLWTMAVVTLIRPGPFDAFGNVKGGDFVHFYALGHVALSGDAGALYDKVALHDLQSALVPASATEHYDPAYPPQVALLFAPFARMPFFWAFLAWAAGIIAVYVVCVRIAWLSVAPALPDRWLVVWAAAAFPPFWNLVMHGQSTVVPLVAFTVAASAFARGQKFTAGLCLGLLAMKPQFALPVAIVSVLTFQGRLIAGMLVTCAGQVLAAAAVFGTGVWLEYADATRDLFLRPALIEPRPYQLHSIRALTRLLPEPAGAVLWGLASAAVIWMLWRAWRGPVPPLVKFGLLVIASTLVSPHLTVYDATVLVPAALWVGAWMRSERYWSLQYWTAVAYLAPTAWLIGVQASVVLLSVLFFTASRAAGPQPATVGPDT